MSKGEEKNPKAGVLDLGLSVLAEKAELLDLSEPLRALALARGKKNGSDTKPAIELEQPVSEYEGFAERQAWQELIKHCEAKFSNDSEDQLEPKLWWVKSHLCLGSMPVSILAAPLDSCSATVQNLKLTAGDASINVLKLTELTKQVLHDASKALERSGDSELAIVFLERAYRISGTCPTELRELVRSQIQKLEQRRNRSSEQEKSLLRLRQLGHEISENLPSVSKNSIDLKPQNLQQSEQRARSPKRTYGLYATLLLLAILLLGSRELSAYLRDLGQAKTPSEYRPLEIADLAPHAAEVVAPVVQRFDPENEDALSVILDTLVQTKAKPLQTETSKSASDQRILIDTSGPVEPPELTDLVERSKTENLPVDQAKQQLEQRSPEDRGDNEPIVRGYPQLPRLPDSGRFVRRLFEIIETTDVFDAPSDRAIDVSRLYPGDRVMVEESLGRWLKVVSRKSRREGYILSSAARALDP